MSNESTTNVPPNWQEVLHELQRENAHLRKERHELFKALVSLLPEEKIELNEEEILAQIGKEKPFLEFIQKSSLETDHMAQSSNEFKKYFVGRLAEVDEFIVQLRARAKKLDMAREARDSLAGIVEKLAVAPLEWGDPLYATKHAGGMVFQGLWSPFIVRYVAFETERIVCILKIRVFPGHPLAAED